MCFCTFIIFYFYLFAIFEVQSPDEHLEALISQAQYGSCKATQSAHVIARSHLCTANDRISRSDITAKRLKLLRPAKPPPMTLTSRMITLGSKTWSSSMTIVSTSDRSLENIIQA